MRGVIRSVIVLVLLGLFTGFLGRENAGCD